MELYLKVTAGLLLALVVGVVLSKYGADMALLLTMFASAMILTVACAYLQPVLDFAVRLSELCRMDKSLLQMVFKIVGIGLISQIAEMMCNDAGCQSLSKALQLLTTAVMLCIAIPALEDMIAVIETILKEV